MLRGEEGWINSPIMQTIAAHHTKMKHWTRFNKDAPVAWYSYTYKFFAPTPPLQPTLFSNEDINNYGLLVRKNI
jgi:hypothetical protein